MARKYLNWDEKIVSDLLPENVTAMYDAGYVFTRLAKGAMHQTRSVRVGLGRFEPTSENRRILKKAEGLSLDIKELPIPAVGYDWRLGKMAKDFYDKKFGPGIMSAQKIKEMLTDSGKSNFNRLYAYLRSAATAGFAICYSNEEMLHYSYPFYDISPGSAAPKDMGLAMMTLAIVKAKEAGQKYAYLGSLQRPSDTYKLQFEGLEWFDGGPDRSGKWISDIKEAKRILSSIENK